MHFANCAVIVAALLLLQQKIWNFVLLLRLGLFLICS